MEELNGTPFSSQILSVLATALLLLAKLTKYGVIFSSFRYSKLFKFSISDRSSRSTCLFSRDSSSSTGSVPPRPRFFRSSILAISFALFFFEFF